MSAKKLTKRQYEAYTARLQALRQQLVDTKAQAIKALDDMPALRSESYGDMLNHLYDSIYEIDNAINDLEHDWNTRNWTWSDWSSYSLVAQNID